MSHPTTILVFEQSFEHQCEGAEVTREAVRASAPMPDLAQDAPLPRGLELQLLLSAAIETLLRLQSQQVNEPAVEVLAELASRFDRAVEELSGRSRTLSQSAAAVGFVSAAQRAFAGTGPSEQLAELSAGLRAASRRELHGDDVEALVTALARLHRVLVATRAVPTDEVRGLRRLA